MSAGDVSPGGVSVAKGTLLDDAARLMLSSGTNALTVVAEDGRPIGSLDQAKLMTAMVASSVD
jgi:CBS domain-containing protein